MNEPARSATPSERAWQGPRVLVAAFVSYFVTTGLSFSIVSVFIRPAGETFAASMATMGAISSLHYAVGACVAPLLGHRFAHGGMRRAMLAGAFVLPVGLVATSRAESLSLAALCYGGIAIVGSSLLGGLAANTLVTNWYGPSRGRALGLVSTGATAANVVVPLIAVTLVESMGWRDALAVLAVASLALTLPAFGLCAIDRPSDIGQEPESAADAPVAAATPAAFANESIPAAPIQTRALLVQPGFWAIAVGFGLLLSLSVVSLTFMVPYAQQLGLTPMGGTLILSARSLSAIAGQVSLGWLSDRVGQRSVLLAAIAFESLCWIALVRAGDALVFTLAGLGIGFVSGSFTPLRSALIARVFGRRDFAKASGLMAPASLPFQLLMVPLAGHLYDVSGSYAYAFQWFWLAFPIVALLIASVPKPR